MNFDEIGLKKGWSGHYNPGALSSFRAFTFIGGTVLVDPRIWAVCGTLAFIAFTIAAILLLTMPDARKIDLGELTTLLSYLKVFLAFLLGMFMNNSLARWWTTVNALTDYLNNIEKLIFCANAFGFPADRRDEIGRFCIVSCYCLSTEVHSIWIKDEDELTKIWQRAFDRLAHSGYLKEAEALQLCRIRPGDRAGICWSWTAAVLYEMFEKDEKKLAPPAMNRMVLQAQIAVDMVSQLKVQTCIQMPFMYVHMLAVLVHLNNLMVSVTSGFGMGGAISGIIHSVGKGDAGGSLGSSQALLMTLVTLFVEPMLYQAFLQIGTNFCYPFGREKYHVPVQWMIVDMVKNLQQMNFITDSKTTGVTRLESKKKFASFWGMRAEDSQSEASSKSGAGAGFLGRLGL